MSPHILHTNYYGNNFSNSQINLSNSLMSIQANHWKCLHQMKQEHFTFLLNACECFADAAAQDSELDQDWSNCETMGTRWTCFLSCLKWMPSKIEHDPWTWGPPIAKSIMPGLKVGLQIQFFDTQSKACMVEWAFSSWNWWQRCSETRSQSCDWSKASSKMPQISCNHWQQTLHKEPFACGYLLQWVQFSRCCTLQGLQFEPTLEGFKGSTKNVIVFVWRPTMIVEWTQIKSTFDTKLVSRPFVQQFKISWMRSSEFFCSFPPTESNNKWPTRSDMQCSNFCTKWIHWQCFQFIFWFTIQMPVASPEVAVELSSMLRSSQTSRCPSINTLSSCSMRSPSSLAVSATAGIVVSAERSFTFFCPSVQANAAKGSSSLNAGHGLVWQECHFSHWLHCSGFKSLPICNCLQFGIPFLFFLLESLSGSFKDVLSVLSSWVTQLTCWSALQFVLCERAHAVSCGCEHLHCHSTVCCTVPPIGEATVKWCMSWSEYIFTLPHHQNS